MLLWTDTLLLLLLLLLIPCLSLSRAQSAEDHGIHCSRERSRTAWEIIDEYLIPFVEQEQYNLSTSCRLHPSNDMFRDQESKKEHITAHQWQCRYCKKLFRAEKFLDQHFDNRHYDKINASRDRCLADTCNALHCDYFKGLSHKKYKKGKCNMAAADRNLHLCERLANTCFPPQESSTTRRLNDFFQRQFCDAHTCKKGSKPFGRGSGRSGAALYIALSVFGLLILLLFYGGIYFHRRELTKNVMRMKRIKKPKPH